MDILEAIKGRRSIRRFKVTPLPSPFLSTPDDIRPVAIVPVGYPDENPPPPERFRKERVIFHLR